MIAAPVGKLVGGDPTCRRSRSPADERASASPRTDVERSGTLRPGPGTAFGGRQRTQRSARTSPPDQEIQPASADTGLPEGVYRGDNIAPVRGWCGKLLRCWQRLEPAFRTGASCEARRHGTPPPAARTARATQYGSTDGRDNRESGPAHRRSRPTAPAAHPHAEGIPPLTTSVGPTGRRLLGQRAARWAAGARLFKVPAEDGARGWARGPEERARRQWMTGGRGARSSLSGSRCGVPSI